MIHLVEFLPSRHAPVPWPFINLVVNLNACSQAHRDVGDNNFCLVLAIGDFKGGNLVLAEQGLVLDLSNGDFVVFRSAETTHLNLEYQGFRASFVLNTDGCMQIWHETHNKWNKHPL